ncbi:MAG: serine hydrolase [Candidatus Aminicenantes bacterium]|nr:serine hydrolase [Candidatus Aminicenantes bacterium]
MTRKRNRGLFFFFVFFLVVIASSSFADQKTEKVDALFKSWDKNDSPGCALAVIQNGEIVYKNGYGMADLENDVPITPGSVFYIGSTSKQFVTMCITLLAKEGKILLDDDIRKYVPEMPDYGSTLTIRHLIHHTSGLRDYLELVGIIAGLNEKKMDEMIGIYHQQDSLELIARQKELNFKPGEKFLYSNSCYLLLAEIVKRASGKTLREYAHENIFEPLGMKNSHFHDDYTELIKNRASGYYPAGKENFRLFLSTFDCVGSGGLFSSVEDLFLWDQNFYHCKVGGKEVIDMMHTKGRLNNGDEIGYAFALMIGDYKGLKTVRHGGALGGYRAELLRFPEQRFSVICLSNLASFNPSGMCNQVADIYLADQLKVEKPKEESEQKFSIDPAVYDDYEGQYRLDVGITFEISKEGTKLMAKAEDQPKMELVPLSVMVFSMKGMDAKLTFIKGTSGKVDRIKVTMQGMDIGGERITELEVEPGQMEGFAGDYYSDELDVTLKLAVKDGKLFFAGKNAPEIPLRSTNPDEFSGGLFQIKFHRDGEDSAVSFTLDTGRVKNLRFVKK